MNSDISSLAHSKWNCKYHIVFAPKYRRQEIYVELQVPHSVRTEISQARDIWKDKGRYWTDITKAMQCEESRNNRSQCLFRSHTYACENTAEYKCSAIHGISEREKYIDDL